MYVVVQHEIKDPETAFARGEKLIKNEAAPAGVRGLQFYPSTQGSADTCLGGGFRRRDPAIRRRDIRRLHVNTCYQVDAELAFAERPSGLPASPAIRA